MSTGGWEQREWSPCRERERCYLITCWLARFLPPSLRSVDGGKTDIPFWHLAPAPIPGPRLGSSWSQLGFEIVIICDTYCSYKLRGCSYFRWKSWWSPRRHRRSHRLCLSTPRKARTQRRQRWLRWIAIFNFKFILFTFCFQGSMDLPVKMIRSCLEFMFHLKNVKQIIFHAHQCQHKYIHRAWNIFLLPSLGFHEQLYVSFDSETLKK